MKEVPPASDLNGRIASTTVRSFRIMRVLRRRRGAGVSEVARDLDMSKSAVHKHLRTLREIGYVIKDGNEYRPGLALMGFGSSTRRGMDIYEAAYDPIQQLAESSSATASLMIPEHGLGVYLIRRKTEGVPPMELPEGEPVYLHSSAGGKAILAYLPESKRQEVIDRHGLPAMTEDTITSREALEAELETVRQRELAEDTGELDPDLQCIGFPIRDDHGRAIAAVTLSDKSGDMWDELVERKIILRKTGYEIQNRLVE